MTENQQDNYWVPNLFFVQRIFDYKHDFIKLEISDYGEVNTIMYKPRKDKTGLSKWVFSREGNPKTGFRKVECGFLDELTKTLLKYKFSNDLLKNIGGNLYFYKELRFEIETRVR